MAAARAVFFLIFTIISIIGLYYSIKSYHHAENYLHQTELDAQEALRNCVNTFIRYGNDPHHCTVPESQAYNIPEDLKQYVTITH
jgi:hypothetical protein